MQRRASLQRRPSFFSEELSPQKTEALVKSLRDSRKSGDSGSHALLLENTKLADLKKAQSFIREKQETLNKDEMNKVLAKAQTAFPQIQPEPLQWELIGYARLIHEGAGETFSPSMSEFKSVAELEQLRSFAGELAQIWNESKILGEVSEGISPRIVKAAMDKAFEPEEKSACCCSIS